MQSDTDIDQHTACISKHVEVWRSATEDYSVLCEFSMHDDINCNIMHESTSNVDLSPLAKDWPTINGCANTLSLPCGHTYHPCALALHFLSADMRCPVCRAGSASRMQISCMPSEMQHVFGKKILSINRESVNMTIRTFEQLIRLFELQLQMTPVSQYIASNLTEYQIFPTLISTRLIPEDTENLNERVLQRLLSGVQLRDEVMTFRVHHSFNRCIQAMHCSNNPQNRSTAARWCMKHQYLGNNICTVSMPLRSLFNCLFEQNEHERQAMLMHSPNMTGDACLASLTSFDTGEVTKISLTVDLEFLITLATIFEQSFNSIVI